MYTERFHAIAEWEVIKDIAGKGWLMEKKKGMAIEERLARSRTVGYKRRLKLLHSESGSALVMVMFVVLMMLILGLAVMRLTVTDAYLTEVRESDVQSLHLAQKTLDEAVATISSQLNFTGDINPEELADRIKDIQSKLEALKASVPVSQDGPDSSWLSGIATAQQTSTRFVITLTAEARVNGIQRKLQQKVTVDSYPEFLRYAFGSENNLILNGAPSITGNIYAGGYLRTSNIAEYMYKGAAQTQSTTYPMLNGNAYVQSLGTILKSGIPVNGDPQGTESALQTALGIPVENVIFKNRQKFVQVNLDDTFIDKLSAAIGGDRAALMTRYRQTAANSSDPDSSKNAGALITSLLNDPAYASITKLSLKPVPLPADATEEQIAAAQQEQEQRRKSVIQSLSNLSSSVIFDGDLTLDGQTFKELIYKNKQPQNFQQWFIVNGNLNIVNTSDTPITIKANIITTGTLTIKGKVAMDSSLYVMKTASSSEYSTVLEDAIITGLKESADAEAKEVVLMSKGSILLNRFDSFNNDQPTQLTGFFYTDSQATLYGVGSKFALTGGFFAKGNLTVNAVNGAAYANDSGPRITFAAPFTSNASRFKVAYNDAVYAHQGLGLPRVNQITISVGKLQLLPQIASSK
ncbi:hypothetical protein [Paenibacillus bovis]|uniref:Type 4 fimbrial biogenesis protein PilX N-terminal domain-containing protein n=1 Tax=Paenibacillus bovis TaxID=1616788 RepID=A0A172ZDK9_9BACL|nr:hypothetical protein [Paenibacillus bovis]ANF95736.1 hypothetical protein AR543_06790 [Paenibacillus bovis]